MKQYEVWWAALPQPAGRRPVLLLSRDSAYEYLNKFVTVEITSTVRRLPLKFLSDAPRDCHEIAPDDFTFRPRGANRPPRSHA